AGDDAVHLRIMGTARPRPSSASARGKHFGDSELCRTYLPSLPTVTRDNPQVFSQRVEKYLQTLAVQTSRRTVAVWLVRNPETSVSSEANNHAMSAAASLLL